MRRFVFFAAVLVLGVGAGFGLRAWLEPTRDAQMAALLEDVCLAFVTGERVDQDRDMVAVGLSADGMFVDRHSRALVQMIVRTDGRRACSVSDTLDPLAGAARDRWVEAGAEFAQRHMPAMPLRDLTDDMGWALFHHYGIYEAHAPGEMNLLITDFGKADTVSGAEIEVVRFGPDGAEA